MDYKLSGPLRHYAFVLLLLAVQWMLVFPGPIHTGCDLERTESLTDLLIFQAKELLDEYIKFHGPINGSVPDDVPNSTISGVNLSEKLRDVYAKNVLFDLHIAKVKQYQTETWGNGTSVVGNLSRVKGNLANLLAKIKTVVIILDSLPTTPAPPQFSHSHDYAKKVYGWGVIVALKDWLSQVLQVIAEAKKVCDN